MTKPSFRMFDTYEDPVFVTGRDGVTVYTNKAAQDVLGLSREPADMASRLDGLFFSPISSDAVGGGVALGGPMCFRISETGGYRVFRLTPVGVHVPDDGTNALLLRNESAVRTALGSAMAQLKVARARLLAHSKREDKVAVEALGAVNRHLYETLRAVDHTRFILEEGTVPSLDIPLRFDMCLLLMETASQFKSCLYGRPISITFEREDKYLWFVGHRRLVRRAMLSAVTQRLMHMESGNIRLSLRRQGSGCVFTVADDGPAPDMEELSRRLSQHRTVADIIRGQDPGSEENYLRVVAAVHDGAVLFHRAPEDLRNRTEVSFYPREEKVMVMNGGSVNEMDLDLLYMELAPVTASSEYAEYLHPDA
ncbi:MAG: PAS domain-containing sensor histidine kinase [Oscillospiraceae bacterium]|nr:PAS domain-containing sensor histidine kinase [Oscillospiraceae bacterium]